MIVNFNFKIYYYLIYYKKNSKEISITKLNKLKLLIDIQDDFWIIGLIKYQ